MPASLTPTVGSVNRGTAYGGLLCKVNPADVRPDPFPYVVVRDALDADHYQALAAGQIDTFLGFKFIRTQRLGLTSGGDRACLAWRQSALVLAIGQTPKVKVTERPDKSYATQVYCAMSVGATRMEEEGVVEIATLA